MFRFSIRDVLWLTLVAAVAMGWFVHYRNLVSRHETDCVRLERRYERRSEYIGRLKDALSLEIGKAEAFSNALDSVPMQNSILYTPRKLPADLENEP